jgi:hypothetical protein
MGLVPLFIHYSNQPNEDHDMVSVILKCMANFSLIEQGVDHLLDNGVINAF